MDDKTLRAIGIDPIIREFMDTLLWEPERTKKLPLKIADGQSPTELYIPCASNTRKIYWSESAWPSDVMPDMPYVILRPQQHTRGFVWIGKCARCKIFYYMLFERPGVS